RRGCRGSTALRTAGRTSPGTAASAARTSACEAGEGIRTSPPARSCATAGGGDGQGWNLQRCPSGGFLRRLFTCDLEEGFCEAGAAHVQSGEPRVPCQQPPRDVLGVVSDYLQPSVLAGGRTHARPARHLGGIQCAGTPDATLRD